MGVGFTEKTVLCVFTSLGGVGGTTSPAAFFTVAGDVAVAKQETAGAAQEGKGVGPDIVDCLAQCHPLRKGALELEADG